jgi:cysteinylglycine-S-conjugate dipeptidase
MDEINQWVSRVGSGSRDEGLARQLVTSLTELLADPPVAASPRGLRLARETVEHHLSALGFSISRYELEDHPPVVVATRAGATERWIGLSGHYDIEMPGSGWRSDPFIPVLREGRLFARGVADNLGPLLLRLFALEGAAFSLPSLVWLLQGEEEIGSPAAHLIYPRLVLEEALPSAVLWLEETGYFELDGRQRVLLRNPSPITSPWLDAAFQCARARGRTVELHDRYLKKAFGAHRCPFLTHVAGGATYLAVGPNDPQSRIHQADESLPIGNLGVSVDQFLTLLASA